MEGYKFLEDKSIAEAVFTAYGKDLAELFLNAALALESAQVELSSVEEKLSLEIKNKEKDAEELLLAFLDRLVYLKDTESLVFGRFEIKGLDENSGTLEVLAFGDKIDPAKHQLRADIKAVTRHDFAIKNTSGGYETTIVLDI